MAPRINRVYKSLNKRRTLCGIDAGLFRLAVLTSIGLFNILHSLVGALLFFGAIVIPARRATRYDPEMLRILLRTGRVRARLDPFKHHANPVRVLETHA